MFGLFKKKKGAELKDVEQSQSDEQHIVSNEHSDDVKSLEDAMLSLAEHQSDLVPASRMIPETLYTNDEDVALSNASDDMGGAIQPAMLVPMQIDDATPLDDEPQDAPQSKTGLLGRLREGLTKTSTQLGDGIGGIFTKRKLDDEALEELEELLIMSDMGVSASARIVQQFGKSRHDKDVTPESVRSALAETIATLLQPVQQPLNYDVAQSPCVIMMVGVNGNGKTTTIGKLAMKLKQEGKTVMLAAADTFRAAAVEQLQVWAERAGVPIVTGKHEADPASVAYSALERAKAQKVDVLLIDTAGRLQNKKNLMQELEKIIRVLQKLDDTAPHHALMVLDGTTGQNALLQAEAFKEFAGVSGFVVTKLDGSAKGGVIVALADKFGLPVHYIGVGESIDDLQEFDASLYAKSLTGVAVS